MRVLHGVRVYDRSLSQPPYPGADGGATEPATQQPAPWREVFRGRNGRLVAGLLLFETLGAIHLLIVSTVMPAVLSDLGNLPLYGWASSAWALAMLGSIPIVSSAADRLGTKPMILVTAALYVVGLTISAVAPSMEVLVVGRFVQGAASGAAYALSISAIAKTMSAALRPRVLALMATAWLLPGLFGPLIAGFLADNLSWRWAFIVPMPFLFASVLMIYPALHDSPDQDAAPAPIGAALLIMVGAGLFLAGLDGGSLASPVLTVVGLVVAILALRRIVQPGTFVARRGAPAAALCAFLLSMAFTAMDNYVPLMLTHVRGMSVTAAGVTISVAALTWALGSWWQSHAVGRRSYGWLVLGRRDDLPRRARRHDLGAARVAVVADPHRLDGRRLRDGHRVPGDPARRDGERR